jgi:hypothetical protein
MSFLLSFSSSIWQLYMFRAFVTHLQELIYRWLAVSLTDKGVVVWCGVWWLVRRGKGERTVLCEVNLRSSVVLCKVLPPSMIGTHFATTWWGHIRGSNTKIKMFFTWKLTMNSLNYHKTLDTNHPAICRHILLDRRPQSAVIKHEINFYLTKTESTLWEKV